MAEMAIIEEDIFNSRPGKIRQNFGSTIGTFMQTSETSVHSHTLSVIEFLIEIMCNVYFCWVLVITGQVGLDFLCTRDCPIYIKGAYVDPRGVDGWVI